MTKFISGFKKKYLDISDLCISNASAEKRNDMVYLIKVLWGLSLIKRQNKIKDISSISIKP